MCFSKAWQDTLLVSLHNFLATIFQCMPQPALSRIETEAILIKKLQEENVVLRARVQAMGSQQQTPTLSSSPLTGSGSLSTHQSRRSAFHEHRRSTSRVATSNPQTLSDVIPFDIPPPAHLIDDFYIIAQETATVGSLADSQARGLRSLIRNIGSGGSPVLGRKESSDRNKTRSGSVGSRSWNLH